MTGEVHTAPTLDAQAADWLALSRSGQMTADDLRGLEAWLAADPAHGEAYRTMQETWRVFGEVSCMVR